MKGLEAFRRWLNRALRPGCEWLRSYEVEAITAFYLSLDEGDREKLLNQFDRVDHQSRSSTGVLLTLFDSSDDIRANWPDSIRISRDGLLVGYKFKLLGRPSIPFVAYLARGGLAELQFKRTPESFQAKSAKVRHMRGVLAGVDPRSPPIQFEMGGQLTVDEDETLDAKLYATENDT